MPCQHLTVSESTKATVTHLLTSGARCAALLAASDAVFWTIDPADGFIEPQPAWQAYTGQTWESAEGMGWLKAVHPEDRPAAISAWSTARTTGEPFVASVRIWHEPARAWHRCTVHAQPVHDAQGEIVEWVGALHDVQDRGPSRLEMQQLNEALRRELQVQDEDLRRLFSVSQDLMVTLDADGRVVSISPSFEALTGTPPSQAVGKKFSLYCHPDDAQKASDELQRVLKGSRSIDFETRLLHRDGSVRTVSWRAASSSGESRAYAVGRDITERRQAEQRLVRAQRLEAVGHLTGGIAHDFNNILGAMLSYIEVAGRSLEHPARLQHALRAATGVGKRGAALVSQLLTFARKQTLALGPVDVNALLRGMADLLQRTLGGTVDVRHELAPELPNAMAEPTQLELAVLNLCINARDAMPGGGRIVLHTGVHRITDAPATRVEQLPPGFYVTLAVIDNGSGMDEATAARCVEPFFTTKGPGHGTGLGLSQVFGIAKQCGGALTVRSRPGIGTRMTIFLPLSREAAAPPAAPDVPAELLAPPRDAAILIVDDNLAILDSTRELLDVLGFRTVQATSAAEAIAVLRGGTPIDLLMTDFAMPDMSGLELLEVCRAERPALPTVLVTGYADLPGGQAGLPALVQLRKPYETDELLEAIDTAMRQQPALPQQPA